MRISFVLLAMVCALGPLVLAGDSPAALVDVITWRIKHGANRQNDYWIDGMLQNISTHRLTGIQLRFNVLSSKGVVLGESDAVPKLMTLLPGQTTVFAAPVDVHDRRMSKMVLMGVKIQTADEMLMFKDIPFSSSVTSARFRDVRRPPSRAKGIGLH